MGARRKERLVHGAISSTRGSSDVAPFLGMRESQALVIELGVPTG